MKAQFLLSTLTEFPQLKSPQGQPLPEVVMAGRSNVGKSSLINHLLSQKIARTSATPGKTQLLNFYLIDNSFLFVDLPGYGFAKAPEEEVAKWSEAIDTYLNQRTTIKLILLLVDCRRRIEKEETSLISWAEKKQIPLLVIFTKTDKLLRSELDSEIKKNPQAVFYSIKNNHSRTLLEKKIKDFLWD